MAAIKRPPTSAVEMAKKIKGRTIIAKKQNQRLAKFPTLHFFTALGRSQPLLRCWFSEMEKEIENSFFFNEIMRRLLSDLLFRFQRGYDIRQILQINSPLCLTVAQEYLQMLLGILEPKTDLEKILSIEFNPNNEFVFELAYQANKAHKKEYFSLSMIHKEDCEDGIKDMKQLEHFVLNSHMGSSFLGPYISLHSLIPQILPQLTPLRFAKIVYQPENQSTKNQSISLTNATVWTSPGMISSIEYMISLLRLSQYHPSIFLSLAPMMRQRVRPSPPSL
jgi:hypothetical protein